MRLHHVALRTPDIDQLVAFYRDVLAVPPWPVQAGNGVWFALGSAVLMIERAGPDEPAPAVGSLELLAFAIEAGELASTRARLRTQGVTIEAETAHTLYFRDPDGRRVALSDFAFPHKTPETL